MKHAHLLFALLGCAFLAACSDRSEPAAADKDKASTVEKVDPKNIKPGQVYVAPVSKVASAPGINPNDAKTIPPMPKAAMFKGPVGAASEPASGAVDGQKKSK